MRTLLLTLTTCLLVSPVQAKYSGGRGTAQDPYQIATAADLILLGESPADYDKHFLLTADIDLDPKLPGRKVFDKAVIAPDMSQTQDGFQGTPFTGVFDGHGRTISHLTIKGAGCFVGVFGQLGSGAEVRELGVVDADVRGSGSVVGALVASNGGVVLPPDEESQPGGIATRCYATGRVSGGDAKVGGLVGLNAGDVTDCYSTAVVSGGRAVGGLVGQNDGTIKNSYAAGSTAGDSAVGGLAGVNGCGGIDCGHGPGAISTSYSVSFVTGRTSVGGLLGEDLLGAVTGCFWDIETSGQTKSARGTGKTTAAMQTAVTFSGWAFEPIVWTIEDGKDYPRLAWENRTGVPLTRTYHYGGGSGTQGDPYTVYMPEQLNMIGLMICDWDKHFKLMADLDMSAFDGKDGRPTFNVIGECYLCLSGDDLCPVGPCFSGGFDGNGHTISRLTVKAESGCAGLFSGVEGQVKNLGVVDVNVTSSYDSVGALVGFNAGTVTECYSTGSVNGTESVGGLVGTNTGAVTECNSACAVSGNSYIGGLVGLSSSPILAKVTQCYSSGAVSGESTVGGLVGYNGKCVVTGCHSTAKVSGTRWSVGGLVGLNERGLVTQCYSTGVVSGTDNIGGLVGSNYGSLSDSNSTCQVSGKDSVGGLAGDNHGDVIECHSTGMVSGTGSNVGGLVGQNWNKVAQCYSTSVVTGGDLAGGLVGYNYEGTVSQCYSTGAVRGTDNIGGLVGQVGDGSVTQCHSTSAVIGRDSVGGLVGDDIQGTVTYCYSAGVVSGTGQNVGGLVGRGNSARVARTFWDTQTSGQTTSKGGGMGKTTAEMQTAKTFLDAGWDFVGETKNGTEDIWWILEGKDYPRLWWEAQN